MVSDIREHGPFGMDDDVNGIDHATRDGEPAERSRLRPCQAFDVQPDYPDPTNNAQR
jgi:hypothetical protein